MIDQPREEQIAVRTYGTRYWCTRQTCGGVLKYTGSSAAPAQHVHKCVACGTEYTTSKIAGSVTTEFVL